MIGNLKISSLFESLDAGISRLHNADIWYLRSRGRASESMSRRRARIDLCNVVVTACFSMNPEVEHISRDPDLHKYTRDPFIIHPDTY
jgi:hypothetical protein